MAQTKTGRNLLNKIKRAQTKTGRNLLNKIKRIEYVETIMFWKCEVFRDYEGDKHDIDKSVDVEIYTPNKDRYEIAVVQIMAEFPNTTFKKSFDGHRSIKLSNKINSTEITFQLRGLPKEDIKSILGCSELVEVKNTYTSLSCKIGG